MSFIRPFVQAKSTFLIFFVLFDSLPAIKCEIDMPPNKYLLKYAKWPACDCIYFSRSPSFFPAFSMIYAGFINLGKEARGWMLFILPSFLLALLVRSTKLEVGKMKSNCRSLISPECQVCVSNGYRLSIEQVYGIQPVFVPLPPGLNHLEASPSCRLEFMPIEMQLIC